MPSAEGEPEKLREKSEKPKRRFAFLGFFGYLKNYQKIFLPALVALFVTAGLSLAFPFFLSQLIGGVNLGEARELDVAKVQAGINKTVIILVAILALQAVISYFRVRGFILAGESALNDLRREVFAHLVRLPMDFFEKSRAGELSGRVTADLGVVREGLLTTLPQLIRQVVTFVGGMIFIFLFSAKLAFFMLAVLPVVVLAIAFFGRKVRGHSKAAQEALAESAVVLEESAQGIADLKSFCNEGYEERRHEKSLKNYLEVVLKGAQARAIFLAFIIFVLFGTISVVAWFGAGMLAKNELSQEAFVAFVLFSIFVGASLGAFPEIISNVNKANGAYERLQELLAESIEDYQGEEVTREEVTGRVFAKGIRFAYPSRPEVEVLRGISFEVAKGQRVAFVGPSGGGKSTLFSLLQRFHEVGSGELLLDQKALSDWPLEVSRSAIAMVPQDVHLFGGSIYENIAYGCPNATEEEVEAAAREANAHEFISAIPEGYQALVGPRGMKLSGGQRQRIAIARAILADPKILLLDEATSALDSESERLVQEALERLMVGRTSLIIAHRLGTVRGCDQIHVLSGGEVVESGTHEELMAAQGTYRLLADTQML